MHEIWESLERKYPELMTLRPSLEEAARIMLRAFREGHKLLVCGNGGSASDADHIVGELMKGFMRKRPIPEFYRQWLEEAYPEEGAYLADHLQGALPAISLVSHHALITAFANDVSAEMVFAQQVYGFGKKGDVLLALSTSGNSHNVVRAIQVARVSGLSVIGMTGCHGGRMRDLCDVTIRVPYDSTPDVQERHLPIYHALCMVLERELFPA
ncbi:phosphoheptose isomerase [Paenibacillus sp. 32O-W]|uniref:D-sedoheptulose-7-phosphate isomerase n=1 Tax=Paenibacillus sp. 32O-W TaxID=1695218 RepID=UPI00072146A3|nr:SIS domain-containing protein [Paenibacillus sp. 32O-W]ALS25595.1 phosphoheptose isomerase [Paenibacillus sp. 32O-W]